MNIGQRVKIVNTNSFWDGKEGVLEAINDNTCTIFVDFIPSENKRIRQDFNIDNVQEIGYNIEESNKRVLKEVKTMTHTKEERARALEKYLRDLEDDETIQVEDGYDDVVFTRGDEEWLVLDEDEAYKEASNQIEEIFDEVGLLAISDDFRDWVINNCVYTNIIYDWMLESYRGYVDDIEFESDDDYDNRLIQELYDNNILKDEDFEVDEEGYINYKELKENVDLDEKKEEYAQMLADSNDPMSWMHEIYNDKELYDVLEREGLINLELVIDKCISEDGIGHFLSSEDGVEVELENGLYAYRLN